MLAVRYQIRKVKSQVSENSLSIPKTQILLKPHTRNKNKRFFFFFSVDGAIFVFVFFVGRVVAYN